MPSGPVLAGGGGLGVLLLVIVIRLLGGNPEPLLEQMQKAAPPPPRAGQADGGAAAKADDEGKKFVAVVLADTEDVWSELFPENFGREYKEPNLVLFSGRVDSACGMATAAVGPFYCPADSKVYLDLTFYDELKRKFKAPGDFAQAYVVAHEIGHHVQKLLGISDEVHRKQQRLSKSEANELSVRLELQADFFAGVWAHHAQKLKDILEPGDVREALRAATAIGDDALQRQAQGYVVPDSFTHGSSEQRVRWFTRGFETGDVSQGDTFKASDL